MSILLFATSYHFIFSKFNLFVCLYVSAIYHDLCHHGLYHLFFKTLKKVRILQSGKGGKLDIDHNFAILTIFPNTYNFFLNSIFFSSSKQ